MQANRVRQGFSITEAAWNVRRELIRAEHRAEAARTELRRLGSNCSSARAVEQLLRQLRVRRWRRQLKSCPSKMKTHRSERDLGRLGLPARTGPEARLLGAGGASLPAIMIRKPFQPP